MSSRRNRERGRRWSEAVRTHSRAAPRCVCACVCATPFAVPTTSFCGTFMVAAEHVAFFLRLYDAACISLSLSRVYAYVGVCVCESVWMCGCAFIGSQSCVGITQ